MAADTTRLTVGDAPQQIVGPERRERVSHQAWCGEGCVNSRRPVNSDVGFLLAGMKTRALLLSFAIMATACSSFSGLAFTIDTSSPKKTYRVVVGGRPDPPGIASTVQQVRLQVLKGNNVVFTDENFYREEVDHLFTNEYPNHEWLNESVLRFGKAASSATAKDTVTIVNRTGANIDVAKIEYAILNEKFIVLGLGPEQRTQLQLILTSDEGKDSSPMLFCTAYANGKPIKTVIGPWRREQPGNQLVGDIARS